MTSLSRNREETCAIETRPALSSEGGDLGLVDQVTLVGQERHGLDSRGGLGGSEAERWRTI